MRRSLQIGLVAAVAAVALAAGVYLRLEHRTGAVDSTAVRALTQQPFKQYSGEAATIDRWQGQVLVVNFWASWCPPCRDEIPGLVSVQTRFAAKGLQVVGIAVDSADKARQAAQELGVNYPVLLAGMETIDLTRRLGNRVGALPFTVVLDRNGRLVASHLGLLTEAQLADLVVPLLG
jgi:thiol-disulfide isomerase/thioredoxin